MGYIDMGIESDLLRARELFPDARRGLMYTPVDLLKKPESEIRADLARVASEYGPCDIVLADVAAGTPDGSIRMFMQICEELSRTMS